MSEIFDVLFGSKARARLLRFFVLNPEKQFSIDELLAKTLLKRGEITSVVNQFRKIHLLLEYTRKGKKYYSANTHFAFYPELRVLLTKSAVTAKDGMFRRLKSVGDVRLVLVSGIFLNFPKSKVDMVLVTNQINRAKLQAAIAYIEAEAGREIRFVLMTLEELHYRLNMLDRFFIEFLEQPHEEIINRVPELKRFTAGLRR